MINGNSNTKKYRFFAGMEHYRSVFKNGAFQNFSVTPQIAEGISKFGLFKNFFSRPKTIEPPGIIPSVKTDLKNFYSEKPAIFWFGHSSYLVHCNGVNILVDPVFSGHASPFSFYLKAFRGSDVYKAADMPAIDIMIITHNHYDHLDKETIKLLAPSTNCFVMPLGVKDYIKELAGNKPVTELDWWETLDAGRNIQLTATPARHFSGRGLKRNESLWASFVLSINQYKIFIGSDSGYDTHFKIIGDKHGLFDIVLLECGQYNKAWPFIHSMPEELITEGKALQAKVLMPVHWAKFALALHDWDEPVKRFTKAATDAGLKYTTPKIGEPVVLDESYPAERWWE